MDGCSGSAVLSRRTLLLKAAVRPSSSPTHSFCGAVLSMTMRGQLSSIRLPQDTAEDAWLYN